MRARQRSSAARSVSKSSAAPFRASWARQRSASARAALRSITEESVRALRTGDRRDVRGHVGDLLLVERARERRHSALPVRHAIEGELVVGLRLVEVGADLARGARVGERVTAAARRRAEEDLFAGDRIAFGGRSRGRLGVRRLGLVGLVVSVSSVSVVSVVSVSVVSVVSSPSTVSGVAVCSSSWPQPTATTPNAATRSTRTRTVRRIRAILHRRRTAETRNRQAAASLRRSPLSLNATKISLIPRASAMIPT